MKQACQIFAHLLFIIHFMDGYFISKIIKTNINPYYSGVIFHSPSVKHDHCIKIIKEKYFYLKKDLYLCLEIIFTPSY